MTLPLLLFAIVAAITAGSALGVVLSRSVVRAAVWLLFTLIGVSFVYLLLGAEFLGAAQLIVYVGGTLVLVVFGVMLTSQGPFGGARPHGAEWFVGGTLAAVLFSLLVLVSLQIAAPVPDPGGDGHPLPGAGPLGLAFLGVAQQSPPGSMAVTFLLPFEIVSIHLLVVLIAAAYLARAKRRAAGGS
ncbi:NADH-quinone oxidoreductase subunit J [Fimbriiglobus ruber]|uniref:NADH-quinone oxidoreductase subunit J n=1 Tax=Fimbriiglobus ruber TaxID=1908690 RepID=A0A225E022_9BACT|nr:NADH-quinone oxidoreductase subunit J [Fimbriiglobus ruber]OWK46573.1 NADH-ubiquinone oxidoreductase chain J [Fimbriiglobus ruber]